LKAYIIFLFSVEAYRQSRTGSSNFNICSKT